MCVCLVANKECQSDLNLLQYHPSNTKRAETWVHTIEMCVCDWMCGITTKTTMQLCVQNNICCSWNKPLQSIQYFLTYESINYWLSRRARLPQSTQFNCQWFNFKIVVFPLFSLLCALYSNSSIFKFSFFHIFRILCLLSLLPSICFKLLVSFRVIIKFL